MVFSKRATAPEHKVVSDSDLDSALADLGKTSGSWFDGTAESVQKRIATIQRIQNLNQHLLETAGMRGREITRYATVDQAMKKAAASLREGLADDSYDIEMPELPSFAVHSALYHKKSFKNGDVVEIIGGDGTQGIIDEGYDELEPGTIGVLWDDGNGMDIERIEDLVLVEEA